MRKILLFGALVLLQMIATEVVAREVIPFNKDWEFHKATTPDDVEEVTLPHCYNAEDGTRPDYYRGEAIYTKVFDAPASSKEQRVFVRFEAVGFQAKVELNGVELGHHKGAFTAFCYELTDHLQAKGNVMKVTVDNRKDMSIAPINADFTMFGGIYRPVSLLVLPKGNITPLDYASPGVYFEQLSADGSLAIAKVRTLVDGFKGKDLKKVSVVTELIDETGNVAVRSVSDKIIDCHGFNAIEDSISVANPKLWDGRKSPSLYTLKVQLAKGGKIVDCVEQTVGFRTVVVDHDKGLSLNGRPSNIRGVNRHQDRPGKGWAISEADHREDMELIKEIGANGIRLAHYPHAEYFYDLCDREGMLVWAEIPFVEQAPATEEFEQTTKSQLIELIRQNYNHPSIFCWSLFNELGGDGAEKIVNELNDISHAEDPHRYTTGASNSDNSPLNDIPDIMAYNTYPGWYWADPGTMQYAIDWKYRPEKQPLAISEYGAGASIKHHGFLAEHPEPGGEYHPEEWQAYCHEINYREIDKRDFLWGTFVWNMFDFASAGRTEGDTHGMNDKGLVTYDRAIPKDAFYFYKANWNDEPMVHITAKRFAERNADSRQIKVYTNCEGVCLIHNGVTYFPDGNPQSHVYTWDNIPWVEWDNQFTAKAERDGKIIYDNCLIQYKQ